MNTGTAVLTRTYKFEQLLSEEGWLSPGFVNIDASGFIVSISSVGNNADHTFDGICLPGLPNLHSHAFQRAMAGLTEISGSGENNFWTWQNVMYEFLGKLDPEDVEAIGAQLFMEMLKGGYTAVAEFHYLHHDKDGAHYDNPAEMSDRIIAAAIETGISLTLLPVLYGYGGFGAKPPLDGQKRFLHNMDQFGHLLNSLQSGYSNIEGIELGIALHSLRAVSPEMIDEAVSQAQQGPIHIHISEQLREVEQCVNWSGKRPVEWLLDHSEVGERWCLLHATHMTESEISAFAKTGAIAGLCPTTEANLGDGLFPLEQFLNQNGRFGVGSDSNTSVDAAEELRLLEYGQRLIQQRRNVGARGKGESSGSSLFLGALDGGRQALGQPIGLLAPGKRADFIILDKMHPVLAGRSGNTILDSWIFTGGRELITDVFVAGRHLVQKGRHINQEQIENRFRHTISRLMSAE